MTKDQMTRLMKKSKNRSGLSLEFLKKNMCIKNYNSVLYTDGVFEHFQEAKINFPPTYRFEINPDDPGHYSSIRVPSWTVRDGWIFTLKSVFHFNGIVPKRIVFLCFLSSRVELYNDFDTKENTTVLYD